VVTEGDELTARSTSVAFVGQQGLAPATSLVLWETWRSQRRIRFVSWEFRQPTTRAASGAATRLGKTSRPNVAGTNRLTRAKRALLAGAFEFLDEFVSVDVLVFQRVLDVAAAHAAAHAAHHAAETAHAHALAEGLLDDDAVDS